MTPSKKRAQERKEKQWPYLTGLFLLVVGALFLRVVGQLDKIFVGGNVWFHGTDPWYHMRLADMAHYARWDMFAVWPAGAPVGYMPLLSRLCSLLGEVGSAYLPPVIGALTLVPVYFIGKEVFAPRGGKVGLLACLFLALWPSEFFNRTMLGHTDHHMLEALFMTLSVLFVMKAYRTGKMYWPLLAGVSMGLYALSWTGVSLLYLIVGFWMWWEFLRRVQAGEDLRPLVAIISISTGVAVLMACAFMSSTTLVLTLGFFLSPLVLWPLSKLPKEKLLFGLTIAVPVALVITRFFVDWETLLVYIFWGGKTYIEEAMPLDLPVAFAIYGLGIFFALAAIWFCKKNKYTTLFLIWSVVLIAANIGQRRWGYYAAIPISLLASFFAFRIADWVGPQVRKAVIVVVIAFLLIPNIQNTLLLTRIPNLVTADWYVALTWLRGNTPEPFQDPKAYEYGTEERPSYGVITWWDYGHWIIRIAHRVPTESPTETGAITARFLAARSEEEANAIVGGQNLPYVIVDRTLISGKWYAVLMRADEKEYREVETSFLWILWLEQANTWKKIYEGGDVKIYERISS